MKNKLKTRFYSALVRIRPSLLAVFIKRVLRIRRVVVETRNARKFWIDPVSHFGLELLREGIYEPGLSQVLEALLRPGDTFVDVGGNEGYFSLLASRLVRNGRVHCVEPQSRLLPVLRKNIELNGAGNVTVHCLALSNSETTRKLFLWPDTNTGSSSFYPGGYLRGQTEDVLTTTLDNFFRGNGIQRVRLLKIDCEGAEVWVMEGVGRIFDDKRVDFLYLDYHDEIITNEKCTEIHTQLHRAGYQLTKTGAGWVYHLPHLQRDLSPLGLLATIDWRESGEMTALPIAS